MKEIKFIHAADIHLGSSLNIGGQYQEQIAEKIDNAIYNTFSRICDQAIEKNVDFLVLAGDIYDQESRSVKANMYFNQQCQRLADKNIPIYLIAGNHDPLHDYANLLDLPDNVFLFDKNHAETKEVYDSDGHLIAAISGFSYHHKAESKKVHLAYQAVPGIWNIGLLHTQLENTNKNYIPSSLNELLEIEGFHYWALGHIHKYSLLHKEINKAVVYSGIPQGRDMGEKGPGGAVLVSLIADSEPDITFLSLSPIIYQKIEIPIDSIENGNITDIEKLINEIAAELLDNYFHLDYDDYSLIDGFIVDWVLTGRGEISALLAENKDEVLSFLIQNLRQKLINREPFIWTRKIYDQTLRPINLDIIQNNPIFSDIEKISILLKENSHFQEELLEELGSIWQANNDHEDMDYTSFELTEEIFNMILEQARNKIMEELLDRRGLS